MRVILIGGSGQLGTEIRRRWSGDEIVAPSHEELEFADRASLAAALDRDRPNLLVNCSAFHNVDRCESEAPEAFRINALAVDAASQLCAERGIAFLTVSTDYVFDGTSSRPYVEDDCPNPISTYGVSKLAGELLARKSAHSYVVRTCGVYGPGFSRSKGYTFIDRVIREAKEHRPLRIVSDVTVSPTFGGHLAVALREIVEKGRPGLYHAANAGAVSWADFADAALQMAGLPARVERISSNEWKAAARRPRYSALSSVRLAPLGIALPGWREGIEEYLRSGRQEL